MGQEGEHWANMKEDEYWAQFKTNGPNLRSRYVI